MANPKWNGLNETEFDAMLQSSLSELPPDDIAKDVTPMSWAMNRILAGFALNAVTFNFLGLEYILPTIGVILTVLGFRTLCKENKWLQLCWIITIVRSTFHFCGLVLRTSIFHSQITSSPVYISLTNINIGLLFVLLLCLWKGLKEVHKKVSLPEDAADGVLALIVWNAIIFLLSKLQLGGFLMAVVMLASYAATLRTLFELSENLDKAGYAVQAAPVRLSDRAVVMVICAFLILGAACGYLCFSTYCMNWQPLEQSQNAQAEEIKGQLTQLGFPEEILEDLTQEDILACEGALQVIVTVNDYPGTGHQVSKTVDSGSYRVASKFTNGQIVYEMQELRMTDIAVELPGEQGKWKLFHHFHWIIDPGFYGTECIQLYPAYQYGENWSAASDVTGQILYNDGAQVYASEYHDLENRTYTTNSSLFGPQANTNMFATFSMPWVGNNHRGYLSYTIAGVDEVWHIKAFVAYTHQTGWMQYPAMSAIEKCMISDSVDDGVFLTNWHEPQFSAKQD